MGGSFPKRPKKRKLASCTKVGQPRKCSTTMGWETRRGRTYYYQKSRQGATVTSRYVGRGELIFLISRLDAVDSERRRLDRQTEQSFCLEQSEIDKPIEKFSAAVYQIVEAVLLATGHHRPKRVWRKKRMVNHLKNSSPADAELYAGLVEPFSRIAAEKPAKGDLAFVQKFIKSRPGDYILFGGDLESKAVNATLRKMTPPDSASGKVLEMGIKARLEVIRNEHGYESASPIEKLLIDQIALCWLRLYWSEIQFSQNTESSTSLKLILFYEKRLNFCQARLTRAIESLAKVRYLARRTPEILQVNIGVNQVNQAAG